jgi:GxxExxY protein
VLIPACRQAGVKSVRNNFKRNDRKTVTNSQITQIFTGMDLEGLNQLSYKIRRAIFKVHSSLGPGLLERVYVAALSYELWALNLSVQTQVGVPVNYNGIELELGFRIDILVQNEIVVEVKSVEALHDVHKKQLLTYLKLTDRKLGLLVNFNVSSLKDKESLIRIFN